MNQFKILNISCIMKSTGSRLIYRDDSIKMDKAMLELPEMDGVQPKFDISEFDLTRIKHSSC